jgi:hypothetical protein
LLQLFILLLIYYIIFYLILFYFKKQNNIIYIFKFKNKIKFIKLNITSELNIIKNRIILPPKQLLNEKSFKNVKIQYTNISQEHFSKSDNDNSPTLYTSRTIVPLRRLLNSLSKIYFKTHYNL